jgi:hypothetical protein
VKSNAALIRGLAISGIVSFLSLAGCGGGTGGASQASNNQPLPQPPPPGGVTVAPLGVMVLPGGVQQFTPTVSPTGANQAVTWSVSGQGCPGNSCGTIDPAGHYTAPATVANPLTVMVTAASTADPRKFASGSVTVETSANNGSLSGQYALLSSGFFAGNPVAVLGSVTADGNGNLVAGSVDVAWGNALYRRTVANSSYSVGSDNHGTMSLSFTSVLGPELFFIFAFALDSFSAAGVATRGRLIDTTAAQQSGTGFLVKQDPAGFSTAAVNGGYTFGLTGPQGIYEHVAIGRCECCGECHREVDI